MGQKTIPKFCKIFRIKAVAGSAINEVLLISFYFGQSSWIFVYGIVTPQKAH